MITLAICTTIKGETPFVEEWLAWHVSSGVSKFIIYDIGSTDNAKNLILDASKILNISFFDWSASRGDFSVSPPFAYKDAARRLNGKVSFVAFIDVGEYLYRYKELGSSSPGMSIVSYLEGFDQDTSAIAINQRIFNLRAYDPTLLVPREINVPQSAFNESNWFKTIARPEKIVEFDSNRSVLISNGNYVLNDSKLLVRSSHELGRSDIVGEGALYLDHQMPKFIRKYYAKQARLAIPNVNNSFAKNSRWGIDNNVYLATPCFEQFRGVSSLLETLIERFRLPIADAVANEIVKDRSFADIKHRLFEFKQKVAVLTMVSDDTAHLLPVWCGYYGSQIGSQHCYIFNYRSYLNDRNAYFPSGIRLLEVKISANESNSKEQFFSDLVKRLLEHYETVIYTAVDEILVAEPSKYASLLSFCESNRDVAVTSYGLQVCQLKPVEDKLSFSRKVMHQRNWVRFSYSACKPLIVREPISWSSDFRNSNAPLVVGDLYLFDLRWCDFDMIKTHVRTSNSEVPDERSMSISGPQYNDVTEIFQRISDLPRVDPCVIDPTSFPLKSVIGKILSNNFYRNNYQSMFLAEMSGSELWAIPERFRDLF